MISEAIDFRYLLIENYKQLKITETELATIFVIDHLINLGNPMITADLLALRMTMKTHEIDKILASLLAKGIIDFVMVKNSLNTTLDPLKKKLYKQFQINLATEQTLSSSKKTEESLNNIFAKFQEYLGRTLSPLEVSKIREWLAMGYSEDNVISALKEAIKQKKKALKSVDKILLKNKALLDEKFNFGKYDIKKAKYSFSELKNCCKLKAKYIINKNIAKKQRIKIIKKVE